MSARTERRRMRLILLIAFTLTIAFLPCQGFSSDSTPKRTSGKNTSPPGSFRTIKQVDVSTKNDVVTVSIVSDGVLEKYALRPIDKNRLIIDIPYTKASPELHSFSVHTALLKAIRIGRYPAKVRLVLDVSKTYNYTAEPAHHALAIRLTAEDAVTRQPISKRSNADQAATSIGLQANQKLPEANPTQDSTSSPNIITARSDVADSEHPRRRSGGTPPPDRQESNLSKAEPYVAVFGGITIPHSFQSVRSTDPSLPFTLSNLDLTSSGIAGLKAGVFQPVGIKWFGVETEFFYTSPHVKQQDIVFTGGGIPPTTQNFAGAHIRIATLAFNAILRYPGERFQPYAGAGLGIFWGRLSGSELGTGSDTSPGLNLLAGARLIITKRIGVFGEYKFNRASFDFGGNVAIHTLYQAHHFVGGLSLLF